MKIRLLSVALLLCVLAFSVPMSGATQSDTLRVMSSNILFSDDYDTVYRMHCLSETYHKYLPDVICTQEAKANQTSALFPLLADEYRSIPLTASDGKAVYQQLIYRKGKFTVLEAGFVRFRDNVIPWGVSWAVFERTSDGERFAVLNTHLTIITDTYDPGKSNNTDGVSQRQNNCRIVLAQLTAIREKYSGIPVLLCGDFNATAGSSSLTPLDSSELLENSVELSEGEVNRTVNTTHTLCRMPSETGGDIIDHIFVSPEQLRVLRQAVIADGVVIQGSDHCPVYVDVQFK